MNPDKIGKFIAHERKNKNYTQKQLADILHVSDRTISKWECGKGFPEVALLLPLCNELEITVNELLTGERLAIEQYMEKAEENMIGFVLEKEENKIKLQLVGLMGFVSILSFVALLIVVCLYTEIISLPVKILLTLIACTILSIGLFTMLKGGRTIGYYKCSRCSEAFVPDFINYTTGVNIITTRRLKCPHCGKRNWCRKVLTQKERKENE